MERRHPWPQEHIDELKRRLDQGETFGEIGKVMGYSRSAIAGQVYRFRQAGEKVRTNMPWPRANKDRLKALYFAGHTIAEISRAIGVSERSVRRQVETLKLTRPRVEPVRLPKPEKSKPQPKEQVVAFTRTVPGKELIDLGTYECHAVLKDGLYCAAPVKDCGGSHPDTTYCASCQSWIYNPEAKSDKNRKFKGYERMFRRAA